MQIYINRQLLKIIFKYNLVFKTASACKHHCDTMIIAGSNYLFIPNRSARLNYGCDARVSNFIYAIAEWEKRIGTQNTII